MNDNYLTIIGMTIIDKICQSHKNKTQSRIELNYKTITYNMFTKMGGIRDDNTQLVNKDMYIIQTIKEIYFACILVLLTKNRYIFIRVSEW